MIRIGRGWGSRGDGVCILEVSLLPCVAPGGGIVLAVISVVGLCVGFGGSFVVASGSADGVACEEETVGEG